MKTNRILRPLLVFLLFVGYYSFSPAGPSAWGKAVIAPNIVVDTTSDVVDFGGAQRIEDLPGPDGQVSLREAIIASNNTAGPDVIAFNIPETDLGFDGTVFTIQPTSPLPILVGGGTTIDGSSQTKFSGNTNAAGPEIVLDGSKANLEGEPPGLELTSPGNHVHSLVVHSFTTGIEIDDIYATGNIVTGCFVGTDATGAVARPNTQYGVTSRFGATRSRIGGITASERNLISGNGVGVFMEITSNHEVLGNLIGTDITGSIPIGNGSGIHIKDGVTGVLIARNRIANSKFYGVFIEDSSRIVLFRNSIESSGHEGIPFRGAATQAITISQNRIKDNGDLGIDLGYDGVTENDAGDYDTGTNNLMNFPVLSSARATPVRLFVTGTLDTINPNRATIEFFANPVPNPGGDPSGHGEGAIFLGTARPGRNGRFIASLPPVAIGTLITATATDAEGNTSEFAENIPAQ